MKYLFPARLAVLLGAVTLAAASFAQEFRVGFVNTDRVFREANTAKAASATRSKPPPRSSSATRPRCRSRSARSASASCSSKTASSSASAASSRKT
jgi:hypothetical protein